MQATPTLLDDALAAGTDAYFIVVYASAKNSIAQALPQSLQPAAEWVRLTWRRPLDPTLSAAPPTCRATVLARRGALIEERAIARYPDTAAKVPGIARLALGPGFAAGTLHARGRLLAAATMAGAGQGGADHGDLPSLAADTAVLQWWRGAVELLFSSPRPWARPLPQPLRQARGQLLIVRRAGAAGAFSALLDGPSNAVP